MPCFTPKPFNCVLLAWVLAGLAGCASMPKSTAPVQVTITPAGMVRYLDAQFPAEQLPARLTRAGVDEQQEIRIRMQDDLQTSQIKQMTERLRQKGYRKILFLAVPRATSEVTGAPETRTELPVPSSPSVAP
ncbi:MAG: ExbD/TolR family protein [Kiritimatiellia bacterium]